MPGPAGSTLSVVTNSNQANGSATILRLSGTYTAADFEINTADGLGFTPSYVRVLNETTGNDTESTPLSADTKGITYGPGRKLGVAVATAGPITTNSTVLIEAHR